MTRVTAMPGRDLSASWSPDGRYIAFARFESLWSPGRLYVTSPLGGGARKVSDLRVGNISWSPDSRFVVTESDSGAPDPLTGIYLIPVSGEEARRIITAAAGTHPGQPIFSPDGRRLAYVSCEWPQPRCDIYVVDVNADWSPVGTPRRIPRRTRDGVAGMCWTEDGRALVYSTERRPLLSELWRVSVDDTRAAEPVEIAGVGALDPAIGPVQHRLAFTRGRVDTDVYRFEVGRPPQPVLTSSLADFDPDYSPDGAHIVFVSVRSGNAAEIWVANADGSDAHQITHLSLRWLHSPRWSPDGRRIAFEAVDGAHHSRVWTIDADGGIARPLTSGPGEQSTPRWSADGTYVSYTSTTTGGDRNMWRTPTAGGAPQQVTTGDGLLLERNSDRYLVYGKDNGNGHQPLLLRPLDGGAARQLVACAGGFTIGTDAVSYLECGASEDPWAENRSIRRIDLPSGRDQKLGVLPGSIWGLGSVSPDGRSILYTKVVPGNGADIMLVENFR